MADDSADYDIAHQIHLLGKAVADIEKAHGEYSVDSFLQMLAETALLHDAKNQLVKATIGLLRHSETSWTEIAQALHLTRHTAWERYRFAESSTPEGQPLAKGQASELVVDHLYTRVELKRMFKIVDETIKNGVFHMKQRSEIWLFVTEKKTNDRVQFQDRLIDDEYLEWQGQTSGRTDRLIQNYRSDGNRILLFYRTKKYEHPNAAFRLVGQLELDDSHPPIGPPPTRFWFRVNSRPGDVFASSRVT